MLYKAVNTHVIMQGKTSAKKKSNKKDRLEIYRKIRNWLV